MRVDYRLPLEKTEKLLGALYGCRLNHSTVVRANREGYEKLESVEAQIKGELLASEINHYDETGARVEGKLNWVQVASNQRWTYLFGDEKRGKEALGSKKSILKDYQGTAVHDCWESYFRFENCRHIICNAHMLRELERLKETESRWGKRMQQFIYRMYEASEGGTKEVNHRARWEKLYQQICQAGEKEEPPPEIKAKGRAKNRVGRNLLNRLRKYQAGSLEYAFRAEVPFTTNQAERDLRAVKVKQKISNSFRKRDGAQDYARIQGCISTLRKQKMNVFQELVNVFKQQDISFSFAR